MQGRVLAHTTGTLSMKHAPTSKCEHRNPNAEILPNFCDRPTASVVCQQFPP